MFCVIAAETKDADIIRDELKKIHPFNGEDWIFATCHDAAELEKWSQKRPDVLLLSRLLPGEDPVVLLREIPLMFSATSIILLVGEVDEQCRVYIRAAEKVGLNNIVRGTLPGAPPYNLITALRYEESRGQLNEEHDYTAPQILAQTEHMDNTKHEVIAPVKEDTARKVMIHRIKRIQTTEKSQIHPFTPPHHVNHENNKTDSEGTLISESANMGGVGKTTTSEGMLIPVAANKGGVGKSTTCNTLGVALAESSLKVVIADLNLAGPSVAGFFKLTPVKGIEALSGLEYIEPVLDDILQKTKHDGLWVLPGPIDKSVQPDKIFGKGELAVVLKVLQRNFDVVIADTPSNFWDRSWMPEVFEMADMVLAVVDQSDFSINDTKAYAPKLLRMRVSPDKIKIVLNKYSPRLANVKTIEKAFCSGFIKEVKNPPVVVATIPNDWDAHGLKGYKGEVVGLDDPKSQWHRLAKDIASIAGHSYSGPEGKEKKKGLFGFLNLKK